MLRIVALFSITALVSARHHDRSRNGGCASAIDYARQYTPIVDDEFSADCAADATPRGSYGAFFTPCTFTFLTVEDAADVDCSTGVVVDGPVPFIWPQNQTLPQRTSDSFDHGSSADSSSSDDSGLRQRRRLHMNRGYHGDSSDDMMKTKSKILSAEELALWPDQCVGAGPRCYPISTVNSTLFRLFNKRTSWPATATHVQVDCHADAAEYGLISTELAAAESEALDVSNSNSREIITTVVALAISLIAVASLCCLCVACRRSRRRSHRRGIVHTDAEAAIVTEPTVVAKAVVVSDDDMDKTVDGSIDAEVEDK